MARTEIRGTPIYISRSGERIALVPEVKLSRKRLGRDSSPVTLTSYDASALFVIDHKGVKRVALNSSLKREMMLLALSFLVGPAVYMLARWSKRNG